MVYRDTIVAGLMPAIDVLSQVLGTLYYSCTYVFLYPCACVLLYYPVRLNKGNH
jgi:hypothetical protein